MVDEEKDQLRTSSEHLVDGEIQDRGIAAIRLHAYRLNQIKEVVFALAQGGGISWGGPRQSRSDRGDSR